MLQRSRRRKAQKLLLKTLKCPKLSDTDSIDNNCRLVKEDRNHRTNIIIPFSVDLPSLTEHHLHLSCIVWLIVSSLLIEPSLALEYSILIAFSFITLSKCQKKFAALRAALFSIFFIEISSIEAAGTTSRANGISNAGTLSRNEFNTQIFFVKGTIVGTRFLILVYLHRVE